MVNSYTSGVASEQEPPKITASIVSPRDGETNPEKKKIHCHQTENNEFMIPYWKKL